MRREIQNVPVYWSLFYNMLPCGHRDWLRSSDRRRPDAEFGEGLRIGWFESQRQETEEENGVSNSTTGMPRSGTKRACSAYFSGSQYGFGIFSVFFISPHSGLIKNLLDARSFHNSDY